jgi:hypothetical protein
MLVAVPLTIFPVWLASAIFVFISAGLLAYAITADGWYRLPMFVSAPFIVAAGAGQWSPLLIAGLILPLVAIVFSGKPTIGAALFIAGSRPVQRTALIGGTLLLCASFLVFPTWPRYWIENLPYGGTVPPVMRFGGIACLLALLRWRRPEARLIVALALVPQTGSWYEFLPLFLVAGSASEAMVLCILSGLAFAGQDYLVHARNERDLNAQVTALMLVSGYLPATIMVLRRPNVAGSLKQREPPFRTALVTPSRISGGGENIPAADDHQ